MADQITAVLEAGLLTEKEAHLLLDFEKRRHDVIKVSEFSFDLHKILS
jgi:hypothetical protein